MVYIGRCTQFNNLPNITNKKYVEMEKLHIFFMDGLLFMTRKELANTLLERVLTIRL